MKFRQTPNAPAVWEFHLFSHITVAHQL